MPRPGISLSLASLNEEEFEVVGSVAKDRSDCSLGRGMGFTLKGVRVREGLFDVVERIGHGSGAYCRRRESERDSVGLVENGLTLAESA